MGQTLLCGEPNLWLRHWENIIPIFDYSMEIRRVIYTTNATVHQQTLRSPTLTNTF
ncbi:MAG: hypothetical protein AAF609_01640 [Cyanobacteria bacterium P01_C01_bin.120]